MLVAIANNDTYLKPLLRQSSKIIEMGVGSRMPLIKSGTELELLANSPIEGHQYVLLRKPIDGFDRGFIWADSVQIGDRVAPGEPLKPVYPSHWSLGMDFASRVIRYCMDEGYRLADGHRERNIIYIEGVEPNGKKNANRPDEWNDVRLLISFDPDKGYEPYFVLEPMRATTEPGAHYTYSPLNDKGAFRIAFGQHKEAWYVDTHGHDYHPALRQIGKIAGHRDLNKDFKREGDAIDIGFHFAVNQHGPYTFSNVGRSSAGCLVSQDMGEHLNFVAMVKRDPRYLANRGFRFDTIVIDGADFAKSKWGYG